MIAAKRSTFVPVVILGLLASALASVASAKTWAALGQRDTHLVASWIAASAQVPLASALSLAALASWGALLVSRGSWRRWIALIGLAIAVGSLITAIVGFSRAPEDLRRAAQNALGAALATTPSLTGWYWVALIADVAVVAALMVAVRDAPSWPTMSSRYDAPRAARASKPINTSLDLWKALDEGEDPTASAESEPPDTER